MSQISPQMLFSSEKELFSWTYLLKEAPRRTKLLISPVCDTLFEDIQIEVECSKNYFKISFSQKVGASGNNIKKEPQKPRPKLKKYKTEYLQRIFTLPAIQCKCNFEFIKQPLKFSDFEGSIKIVQMISFPNPVSTLRSLRWMRKRLLNERNNESNQSNIFRLIWFMLQISFDVLLSASLPENVHKNLKVFYAILGLSLNKQVMCNGLHLFQNEISLLNILMILKETLISFLINRLTILADIIIAYRKTFHSVSIHYV